MVVIGFSAYRKVRGSDDYFIAGGKLPWWLAGISHHVGGYSGAVFVAYAGVAYTHGFTIYVWWALTIAAAIILGAYIMAPRWARLRINYNVQSPTEYLSIRYNVPTQQLMAWCGVLLKLFDVGANVGSHRNFAERLYWLADYLRYLNIRYRIVNLHYRRRNLGRRMDRYGPIRRPNGCQHHHVCYRHEFIRRIWLYIYDVERASARKQSIIQ